MAAASEVLAPMALKRRAAWWLWIVAVLSVAIGLYGLSYLSGHAAPAGVSANHAGMGWLLVHASCAGAALLLGPTQFFTRHQIALARHASLDRAELRRALPAWRHERRDAGLEHHGRGGGALGLRAAGRHLALCHQPGLSGGAAARFRQPPALDDPLLRAHLRGRHAAPLHAAEHGRRVCPSPSPIRRLRGLAWVPNLAVAEAWIRTRRA